MTQDAKILNIDAKYADPSVNIALDTISRGKQALFFVNTKPSAEKLAEEISLKIKDVDLPELSGSILNALAKPTSQCKRLAEIVKRGVAFHHSGLVAKQREIIEESFKRGLIKIICSTPTLSIGIDMPAFRSVVRDLKRYGGSWGMAPISVLEYHQMAGRAGRPSFDAWGEAITIARTDAEKEAILDNYIKADVENIYSKLAVEPVLRTYVLSLISTGIVRKHSQIMDFFAKTFWAHQYKDLGKLTGIIERMLELLSEWQFISSSGRRQGEGNEAMFVSASELHDNSDESYRATAIGKRVAELYIDPYTAHVLITAMQDSDEKKVVLFSIIHMVCNTLEMRPLLSVRSRERDLINSAVARYEENLLFVEPSAFDLEYDDFLGSIKTALFMMEWCEEMDEEYLFEKYNVRPGEVREKLERANWLLYSSIEIGKLLGKNSLVKDMNAARVRLKYGIKAELLPLIKLEGIGRVRARKMFNNGVRDLGDARKIDEGSLAQILGKAVARSVKEQLGDELKEPVSEHRRKGQMGLGKYGEN